MAAATKTNAKTVVVALGGNAILQPGQAGTFEEQLLNIDAAMRRIAELVEDGWRVVLTHGNGPQVGNLLIQNALAAKTVAPMPMDVCGAMRQGEIGYMAAQTLANHLSKRKLEVPDVAATAELAASRNELKVLRDELQRAKEDHADACRSYESKLEGVNVELRKSAAQLRATCEQTDRLLEQVRMLNATPDLRKAVDVHLSALVEWDVDRKNYEGAIDQMRENLKRSASDLRELRERMEARLSQKCKELERLKLSIGSVLDGEDVED